MLLACLLLGSPLWLAESHTPHCVLYVVVQELSEQNKTTQQTKPTPAKIPPTTTVILTTNELRFVSVERESEYYTKEIRICDD